MLSHESSQSYWVGRWSVRSHPPLLRFASQSHTLSLLTAFQSLSGFIKSSVNTYRDVCEDSECHMTAVCFESEHWGLLLSARPFNHLQTLHKWRESDRLQTCLWLWKHTDVERLCHNEWTYRLIMLKEKVRQWSSLCVRPGLTSSQTHVC